MTSIVYIALGIILGLVIFVLIFPFIFEFTTRYWDWVEEKFL